MLNWDCNKLPKLQSENKKMKEEYCRFALYTFMSHYENPNYTTDLFWAVGTWQFTVSWDTSYASDLIKMLDTNSLKDAILTDFVEVQMHCAYVRWHGAFWDNVYIKKPFALQFIIQAFLPHTGDLGWIDVEYNTEKINEISTAGYDHAVLIKNTLTVDLLYPISDWATQRGYIKWDSTYREAAQNLEVLVEKFLWNECVGWFNNYHSDGTKGIIWTHHLFDLLATDYLPDYQMYRVVSHLREGEFLWKYGGYSIARRLSADWDLIDLYWGGREQYAHIPGRIARNLYQNGFAGKGLDVLNRNIRYIDHFPYLPQNPGIDVAKQNCS